MTGKFFGDLSRRNGEERFTTSEMRKLNIADKVDTAGEEANIFSNFNEDKFAKKTVFPCSRLSFPIFCSQKTWEHVPKIPKNVPTAVASERHVPTVPTVPTKK